ncbi:class A beta-lactamase-related serine hydrolase [Marinifilum sp. JC070]|uniref:Class A beta-lactamase-related serine hydrolase n=2 Tax=Marinifilum caeruleilacunae TaxID=2499076 RepID=A0ABX1WQY0_9BACT|nr:class A beta-lactamase-related serine hydrolase [Marinifilum caeruleilacunae]
MHFKSYWMKIKLFALAILFVAIFQACTSSSFKQNIELKASEPGLIKEVDSIVIHKMNQYNIPGLSIGIIKNDSIIYSKGYGIRSIKNRGLVTENTVFHTASISKLFTAVAIMKLAEQNALRIDDKLVDILPDLLYNDKRVKEISIKNLLNHTSGLPDIGNYHWENYNQSDNSLKEYVLGLSLQLESEPNTEYHYSNLGYDILGHVIEKASGTSFDDFMKKHILNPSGMHQSDFRHFKIADSLQTAPHSKHWLSGNVYTRKTYPYTREHAASSTLNSSSKELSKWMISFLQLLENPKNGKNYAAMLAPSFESYPYMGLGFQLGKINAKNTIGHYGGDKGFRSYLLMIPEEKIGLVVLANCDYHEDFRQEILHPIAKRMLSKYKEH